MRQSGAEAGQRRSVKEHYGKDTDGGGRHPGHVYPMLAIARHLIAQGHQVRVMTGALFRERAEAAGANFVPFDAQVDFDYRHLEEHFPARAAAAG